MESRSIAPRNTAAPDRRHRAIQLRFPIKVGSETIDVVYVRAPRAAEMGLVPAPTPGARLFAADYHPFAARLCGLALAEFDLLEAEDYAAIMVAVNEFSAEVPPTGASASPGSRASSTSGERIS